MSVRKKGVGGIPRNGRSMSNVSKKKENYGDTIVAEHNWIIRDLFEISGI